MAVLTDERELAALLVIDPYNDFISEGGKVWGRLKGVAEENDCVAHMSQVLDAARAAQLRVFYALHHRYRPGDYADWKYIAPIQRAAWSSRTFFLASLPPWIGWWAQVERITLTGDRRMSHAYREGCRDPTRVAPPVYDPSRGV